ncbi:MAG TPA: LamG-like jellyroll fold domain-containing protein [Haliangiales bacterium]|nr:LamG-like jellyroll fold domain-containing protein [Haliangiales bacterium]
MQANRPLRSLFASPLITAVVTLLAVSLARAADYQSAVLSDGPQAYYRFNEDTSRSPINKNSGSLGAAGNATNDLPAGVVHPFPGAIAGDGNRSEFFDFSTRTEIPWNAALNPPNNQPFTVEAWFYPASDQTANGQCPINNRYAPSGADRQGWVFFQRKPDASYTGGEQVGWNCRMYNGIGSSGRLDVTSLVPYQVGKWQHVVVVYDPVEVTNATLTIYIDGVAANTNIWTGGASGTDPGYAANTNDHADTAAALSIGNYNNTAGTSLNPYFGAVDEFALYTNKLTGAQILAHYQNGTNANRGQPYEALIKSHNPVVYLRLDEIAPGPDSAINLGDLRSGGLATHTAEARHPAPSALAGRTDDGAAAYHNRNGNSTTTMPWTAENNPDAGTPFTFETWLRPMRDRQGGQCPVNNRWVGTGRTGWVIFQRNPNLTYAVSEGHGWNFRMYSGVGTSGQDVLTDTDYQIGEWSHLVVTWEPQTDNGDPASNGNHQFEGILTAYFNGVAVASNTAALYAANVNPPEDAGTPADFAVGSYNAKSGLGNNAFEGDVDDVAIYNGFVLTPDQILAHYQAGTNANYGTNYETLVLTAGLNSQLTPGSERTGLPKTYLRFNDPAHYPVANGGSASYLADGNLILTTNSAAGPQSPAYAGFESSNAALPLDGSKSWASLNNPPGLNISGQLTLEAWVKPDAVQGDLARIISHGPPTLSDFLDASPVPDNAVTNGSEVFLRIDGAGANYVVGSSVFTNGIGTNTHSASFAVPAGDLGGANWVHLVGTYDGANWKLFRNGAPVATNAAPVGALLVNEGDWAIGSTGNGWTNFYAGGIDEVAIYNTALTPTQVATHYLIGKTGTAVLTITNSGNNVAVAWPLGTTLQEAASLSATFTDVPGSPVSPLTITAGGTKFYRFRL